MQGYMHEQLRVGQRVIWADLEHARLLGYVERALGQDVFTITGVYPEDDTVTIDHPDPALATFHFQESWFVPAPNAVIAPNLPTAHSAATTQTV